jgi:hypothetical protein
MVQCGSRAARVSRGTYELDQQGIVIEQAGVWFVLNGLVFRRIIESLAPY